MALYRHPTIEVIVAGGLVRRSDGAVIGSSAVDLIRQFKVDMAVIGASALDEDGSLLDFDPREVTVSRAIIDNARRVLAGLRPYKTGAGGAGPHRPYVGGRCICHRPADVGEIPPGVHDHSVKVIETAVESIAGSAKPSSPKWRT